MGCKHMYYRIAKINANIQLIIYIAGYPDTAFSDNRNDTKDGKQFATCSSMPVKHCDTPAL